uniref:Uncharacterized protein n=1 Tax=Opuntia streptacantha TaxID=393608 RepID=A0A7C8ZEX6_OPUST
MAFAGLIDHWLCCSSDNGAANLCYMFMLITVAYIMSGVFQGEMEGKSSSKLFYMFFFSSICVLYYFSCYVAIKLSLPFFQDMTSCLLLFLGKMKRSVSVKCEYALFNAYPS